jgi:hypothetical protein
MANAAKPAPARAASKPPLVSGQGVPSSGSSIPPSASPTAAGAHRYGAIQSRPDAIPTAMSSGTPEARAPKPRSSGYIPRE